MGCSAIEEEEEMLAHVSLCEHFKTLDTSLYVNLVT
jgi:hypothetical protein